MSGDDALGRLLTRGSSRALADVVQVALGDLLYAETEQRRTRLLDTWQVTRSCRTRKEAAEQLAIQPRQVRKRIQSLAVATQTDLRNPSDAFLLDLACEALGVLRRPRQDC